VVVRKHGRVAARTEWVRAAHRGGRACGGAWPRRNGTAARGRGRAGHTGMSWPPAVARPALPRPPGRWRLLGLVLKCYESTTRQHKMLNVNILHPSKHYFPKDIMIFGRRVMKDIPSSA
jgi:hypothetical protein